MFPDQLGPAVTLRSPNSPEPAPVANGTPMGTSTTVNETRRASLCSNWILAQDQVGPLKSAPDHERWACRGVG